MLQSLLQKTRSVQKWFTFKILFRKKWYRIPSVFSIWKRKLHRISPVGFQVSVLRNSKNYCLVSISSAIVLYSSAVTVLHIVLCHWLCKFFCEVGLLPAVGNNYILNYVMYYMSLTAILHSPSSRYDQMMSADGTWLTL